MGEPNEMYVFTASEVSVDADGRPVSVRRDGPLQRVAAIPMDQLRGNFSSFVEGAETLMAEVDRKVRTYQVKEVEISAQIGADGMKCQIRVNLNRSPAAR